MKRLYLHLMLRVNQALSSRYMIWSAGAARRAKKFSERLEELGHA